jgi:hypothetical protein
MKEKILEIIKSKPKHYSKIVKNDNELKIWVENNSLIKSDQFASMIYSALYQETDTCEFNKKKKFKDILTGFIGCGPSNVCECARTQVSNSVKEVKKHVTQKQQEIINNKRRATNLEKYGVTCVAQTEENKQKFQNWYNDPINVQSVLERIKKTNIEKYGVENCKSLPEVEQKIIATCLSKYGVKNVSQIPSTKIKLRARIAEYKLSGHLIKKGYDRFSNYVEKNYNFNLLTSKEEYLGVDSNQIFKFSCKSCNNIVEKKFVYGSGLRCQLCNPITTLFTSIEEQEVFDYVTKELGISGRQSDRLLIMPYELDMVFDNEKIAIEYCGLYWHSEASSNKTKDYHFNKMKLTNQKGYRLITIFSDEWKYKKEIVKSKLKNIFQQTSVRHYARNLLVKPTSYNESKEFLEKFHLQGNSTAKINLGLYTKTNQLVALMTFSNGRAALNSKSSSSEFELVRFVTNGDSVVGGASKILKHFIKNFNPTKIISYADLRWSEGHVYELLGFKKETNPTIGYWYTSNYEKREHRFNFTKNQLIKEGADPSKTEWQLMQELGYDRIWDCGHQKYIMDIYK